jgi:aminoglycoside phosphotransferase (APT) family kinase protein
MLLRGEVERQHVEQFARLLGTIHRKGVGEGGGQFDDRSYFESLRLEPYYLYSAERMPAMEGFINDLVADTRNRRYTLIHGDYSPKNVLVHEGNLILLDHEVIHFGDGAFDIGFALTHLLSKAHALPKYRDQFADAAQAFWTIYRNEAGADLTDAAMEELACRHTLGCMLARCIGRSPLEYLKPAEAATQANAASALMDKPPAKISDLIDAFIRRFDAD